MTRRRLTVLALVVLAWPAAVRAQGEAPSCNLCEHLCMWAPLLRSAERTKQLFENADVVNSVKTVKELDGLVNGAMFAWQGQQGEQTDSPCYKIIVKEFYGGDRTASTDLDTVISHLPPSGNLFHTEFDKPGCPVVANNPRAAQMMCGPLLDAYEKHEEVHKQQCLSLWKKGKSAAVKAFSDPKFFAASEVKAYTAQIELMRQSMDALIKRKGCNVSTYSIKDFAPPPDPAVDLKKAQDIAKGLQLMNDYNARKGGKK